MLRFFSSVSTLLLPSALVLLGGGTAAAQDTYDILTALVSPNCANLAGALNGVTVFGPTDEAFLEFFQTKLRFTVEQAAEAFCGSTALRDLLLYHVIEGTVLAEDVIAARPDILRPDTLLAGRKLRIDTERLVVNRRVIVDPDAITAPYVLHGIGGILFPPEEFLAVKLGGLARNYRRRGRNRNRLRRDRRRQRKRDRRRRKRDRRRRKRERRRRRRRPFDGF